MHVNGHGAIGIADAVAVIVKEKDGKKKQADQREPCPRPGETEGKIPDPGRILNHPKNKIARSTGYPEQEKPFPVQEPGKLIDQDASHHPQGQLKSGHFQATNPYPHEPEKRPAGKINDAEKAGQEFQGISKRNTKMMERQEQEKRNEQKKNR
jgi:hypothetical protein